MIEWMNNPFTEVRVKRMQGTAKIIYKIFAVFLLLIALSEASLRYVLGLGHPVLITPDAACDYIMKPDQRVSRFFAMTRINHEGMRSEEVNTARKQGNLRILFLGDSITYGTGRVDQNKIFTELVRRDLGSILHRQIEVLNASAGGWAIENEVSFVSSRGIFASDIVVIVVNDGDLTQPEATLSEVSRELPQIRPIWAIGELYSRVIKPRFLHAVSGTAEAHFNSFDSCEQIRKNLIDLNRLDRLVTANHARLVLMFIPFRKDVPHPGEEASVVFRGWCDAHKVTMIDLTFAEKPYSAAEITLDHGIHFNAKGHLVIARAMEAEWPKWSDNATERGQ